MKAAATPFGVKISPNITTDMESRVSVMAEGVRLKHKISAGAHNTVLMAEHQAFARNFNALFADGMALLDKISAYFNSADTQIENTAWAAEHSDAWLHFYEYERKRLGALVMQIAAWLWLERALREGDMRAETVAAEKKKLVFAVKPMTAEQISAVGGGKKFYGTLPADTEVATDKKIKSKIEKYHLFFNRLPPHYCALAADAERFIKRIRHMDHGADTIAAGDCSAVNSVNMLQDRLQRNFRQNK